ncbi:MULTISPECIES: tripartite tricarboxylate transporter substrate binding protein [unclassified Bordetella]|uniref:Bug family tripartite tricarboxylate transporter substrate binding protein n=1 Tax=unclassified Bordetella TaxID=2630031 RepID=UPI00132C2DAC|nr:MULTISPECIES: tripartite tricarboxylate transporter substrate binding protein [unclassified Bordetella]MVW70322.1 tripartite tricarboxylate transporter substrate binding protein [Bordetella sp. 15P40C-2]MVW78097.1 tripartite tricarboxylate transporter substrate binding protein [Bordetella sp. 02P26C-1]
MIKIHTLHKALSGLALATFALAAPSAYAQNYPSQPIKMIVPYAPGGATDIIGRLVGKALSEKLGQPVVVENRAGGNTGIGAATVARSAPDGYTVLFTNDATFVLNPAVAKNMPYKLEDLTPVGTVCYLNLGMAVNADTPVNNMKELQAYTNNNPKKFAYGSFGVGSHPHFMGEIYNTVTGSDVTHVPYKGSSPAVVDVVGNQVLFTFPALATIQGHVKDKRIKVLAISGEERSSMMPDVPTFTEAGYPDLNIGSWYGFFAPAGTPKPIVDKLNTALAEILDNPEVSKSLIAQGTIPLKMTPAEMETRMTEEIKRMKAVAQSADISIE